MTRSQEHKAPDEGDYPALPDLAEDSGKKKPGLSRPSLFFDPILPKAVRYGVPVLLWANAALMLYANLSNGASVIMSIEAGSEGTFIPPPLYNVTLQGSVKDLWDSKAYVLSVAIAVFSGAWPHAKILTTLACWFLPESILCASHRKFALFWSYVFNKYSHIETFVLVILMAAFTMSISPPHHPTWDVRTYVTPQPGFFCFLGGLTLSMLISRLALYSHNLATSAPRDMEEAEGLGVPAEAGWEKPVKEKDNKGQARPPRCEAWCVDVVVCYLLLGALALFIAGIQVPSYTFNFEGLAGWVMSKICREPVSKQSSLLTLGMDIGRAAKVPGSPDVRVIQVAYMFFSVVAPLLCMGCLLACLMVPRRLAARLLLVCEVLYAWSAPDVLIIAMVASILEMELFVTFVIGDKCDGINNILRQYFDKELSGDDQCMDIRTSLGTGVWLLMLGVVIFFVVGYAAMRLIRRRALESPRGKKKLASDVENGINEDWRVWPQGPDEGRQSFVHEEESKWPSRAAEEGKESLNQPLLGEYDDRTSSRSQ